MGKTRFGILAPGESAREVVDKYARKAETNLGDWTRDYEQGIRNYLADPDAQGAAVRKIEAFYRAMLEENITQAYGEVMARVKGRMRRQMAGVARGAVAPAP